MGQYRGNRGRTVHMAATKENVRWCEHVCKACAGPRPCISGMRKHYWGKDAHIVKCGQYAYVIDF